MVGRCRLAGVIASGGVGGFGGEVFVGAEVFLAFGAEVSDGVGAVGEVAGVEAFGEGIGEVDEGAAGVFEGVERLFGFGHFAGVADEVADEFDGVGGLARGEGAEELEAEDLGDEGLKAAAVHDLEVEFAGLADEDAAGVAAAAGAHFLDGFDEGRVMENAVAAGG